jgi:hypothetical protein
LQTINALLYASGIYVLAFVIAMFVSVIIVVIDKASAGRIKRRANR